MPNSNTVILVEKVRSVLFISLAYVGLSIVKQLGKVVTTVLRIYPSSPIETSSNSFRDQILSMAYDLMINGHRLFESDKAFMDQDEFCEDIFRRVYGRAKRVGLKGGPLYKHLYPQAFWFGFSLLGELSSSTVALSSDLKEFADYMKVKTSEELSVVRQSMTIFAEDLKVIILHQSIRRR